MDEPPIGAPCRLKGRKEVRSGTLGPTIDSGGLSPARRRGGALYAGREHNAGSIVNQDFVNRES